MHRYTLAEHRQNLLNKSYSSVELTQHYLRRIAKLNPSLNAYITVSEAEALHSAKQADKLISEKGSPFLCGIPIAHKDIFCTKGIRTTCGSKMLDNFISPYNATLVQLLQDAGVVMLGKTNMDEFAMGSSTENSYYGPSKNPWDISTVPGGSSGGSAVAVAAGLATGSTGTDTGGSIRQPAALTGITGLKPTYGRISRFGMIAYASSLDHAGPMAQSAEDCAYLLQAMAGHDPKDSTSIDKTVPKYLEGLTSSLKGKRIGLPKEFFNEDLSPSIHKALQEAIKVYEKLGATVKSISLPNIALSIATYYIIAPAECSSNLARYDGIRYGYRCKDPKNLEDLYKRSRSEAFGKEVKRRIFIGTYVLSSGYYDAYYLKAQKIRQCVANDYKQAFEEVDLILGPTSPTPAFKIGEKSDPLSMYLCDMYTISVNLAGVPGISLPVGSVNGLPIGMQLIANHFEEGLLLNAAHQFQLNTEWHQQHPTCFEEDLA